MKDADRLEQRMKLGMMPQSTEVTERVRLTKEQREGMRTTEQLLEKRFKLDNKDINAKTKKGQAQSI